MSIRLSEDEAWAVIDRGADRNLTTIRRDGMPITLPMWFVTIDRTICFSTPSGTKKVARLCHDPRGVPGGVG